MAEHRATIEWETAATAADFVKGRYSREHAWSFDGGVTVPASPSPSVVAAPWSNVASVDPEEAFVAAVASCHMLTFLYVAAKAGFAVAGYRDVAVGVMTKNERGTPWISKITLTPDIIYSDKIPSAAELDALHHAAHEGCFIAASIKTEVVIATPS
ncbi:MAG: OsmC family protein [Myxococcota bacterium]|nr:OsmC family protein [Myxococcota bacterium]